MTSRPQHGCRRPAAQGTAQCTTQSSNPQKLLKSGMAAKETGDLSQAEACLRKLLEFKTKKERVKPLVRIAAYELALLLLQCGRHHEADKFLLQLGFIYKLSPKVFQINNATAPSSGADSIVAAFDDALPPSLLKPLRHAFGPESAFWPEHGYPTPCFFSYNEPLNSARETTAQGSAPLIRKVVQHVLPSIKSIFPNVSSVESVEWWAHIRPASSGGGHQLHFDLDEAGLSSLPPGTKPTHPVVSCVLYLSDSDPQSVGGQTAPTLVTDQSLDQGSIASRAWLCVPKLNRLLLFDGGLLHGVIPQAPGSASFSKYGKGCTDRITLMLGLWGKQPSPTLSQPSCASGKQILGPNMPVPGPTSSACWPRLFTVHADAMPEVAGSGRKRKRSRSHMKDDGKLTATRTVLFGPVSPVWVPVARDPEISSESKSFVPLSGADKVDFFGRWFLTHSPELLQELVVEEAHGCSDSTSVREERREETLEIEEISMEEFARLRNQQQTTGKKT